MTALELLRAAAREAIPFDPAGARELLGVAEDNPAIGHADAADAVLSYLGDRGAASLGNGLYVVVRAYSSGQAVDEHTARCTAALARAEGTLRRGYNTADANRLCHMSQGEAVRVAGEYMDSRRGGNADIGAAILAWVLTRAGWTGLTPPPNTYPEETSR